MADAESQRLISTPPSSPIRLHRTCSCDSLGKRHRPGSPHISPPSSNGQFCQESAQPSNLYQDDSFLSEAAQRIRQWFHQIDRDAIYFGARMAVCLTLSSLFVLAQSPADTHHFPEGMWVLITVLFVCWFPTLDAASVLEKSIQRLIGTLIGAALGVLCGFISLFVEKQYGVRAQAICLACSIALVSFSVCGYAVHVKIGGTSLITRYNYAVILLILTFSICLMPFYTIEAENLAWKKSLFRVVNVVIGCFLGVGLSMVVFPRPTVCILQDKISKQIELAGEAAEAVLHTAVDMFSESTYAGNANAPPLALADEILASATARQSVRMRMPTIRRPWRKVDSVLGHDVVLEKYEAATKEWRTATSQLGMLRYDPFNIGRPNDLLQKFRTETANTLARAQRIQTTVVLIDGIVRNDPKHRFSEEHLHLLSHVGNLIRKMLTVPLNRMASDAAAKELSVKLVMMRKMTVDLAATVAQTPDLQIPTFSPHEAFGADISSSRTDLVGMYGSTSAATSATNSTVSLTSLAMVDSSPLEDDRGGRGAPKMKKGSHVCSLLFLQLAEHLTLRSVRLYQSWRQMEGVCETAEHLKASIRESLEVI